MSTITVENTGPIVDTFEYEMEGPGLYEARGPSGIGKSTIQKSLQGLIPGCKVDLTVNENARTGRVSGFGRVVEIESRKRPKGDWGLETIDSSRFDLMAWTRPDGKTAATRDKSRINALAAMTQLQLEPSDFGLTAEDIDPTADPILLANRAKAHYDKLARRCIEEADKKDRQIAAKSAAAEGIRLDAPSDQDELVVAFDNASRALTEAITKRKAVDSAKAAGAEAQDKLDEIDESGQTAEELTTLKEAATNRITEIEEELAEARSNLGHISRQLEARERLDKQIDELRLIVGHGIVDDAPTEESIAVLQQQKMAALSDMEYGIKVREATKLLEESAELIDLAALNREAADEYRENAKSVFATLASRLELTTMQIESVDDDLRLVMEYEGRNKPVYVDEAYDGLSGGERVKLILDEIVHRLGKDRPALVIIPQPAYQELQPASRRELAAYAEQHQIKLIGAQVTDGDKLEIVKVSSA